MQNIHILLTKKPLSAEKAVSFCKDPRLGAESLFIGNVRIEDHTQEVLSITYEVDYDMAIASMQRICQEAQNRFNSTKHYVAHRYGDVAPGESAIVIAVSSKRRMAAMQASQWILERIKEQTPIWKFQHYANGQNEWKGYHPITTSVKSKKTPNQS